MKIKMKKVSEIKQAAYNPKSRTQEKNIAPLKTSILKHGLLIPIMIDGGGHLIDGHRRLAVFKALRKATIPCIEVKSTLSKDKIFEQVNSTQKKITAKDMIYIFINGGVVPRRAETEITALKQVIGDSGLSKLASYGTTFRVYGYSVILKKYIKNDSIELKQIIMWMSEHNCHFNARQAMSSRVSKDVIASAIKRNKPLQRTFK